MAVTAIHRETASVPVRYWQEHGWLTGDVLDFGSGYDKHTHKKYDVLTEPHTELLLSQYDTVMCNYVFNVQPAHYLIIQTALILGKLLKPKDKVLIAIRSDLKHSYTTHRGTQIAHTREGWADILSEVLHITHVPAKGFYGYTGTGRWDSDGQ